MQITLRGIDPKLAEALTRLAKAEGISLNKAALKLLHRAAGVAPEAKTKTLIGSDLDHLFGTWKAPEADAFLDSIRSCEQIDAEFWK
jgi:hypothetical protein